MTEWMEHGSLLQLCKIGTAKATVLPEPVREPPMQSAPESRGGIQADWIRVGVWMAIDFMAWLSQAETPREVKDLGLV